MAMKTHVDRLPTPPQSGLSRPLPIEGAKEALGSPRVLVGKPSNIGLPDTYCHSMVNLDPKVERALWFDGRIGQPCL